MTSFLKLTLFLLIILNLAFTSYSYDDVDVFTYKMQNDEPYPYKIEYIPNDSKHCSGQIRFYFENLNPSENYEVDYKCQILRQNQLIGTIEELGVECIIINWSKSDDWKNETINYYRFYGKGHLTGKEFRGYCE